MKIDLVYLWVDGSDEKWLEKKNVELEKNGKLPVEAIGKYRSNDNDELLFSLRSVKKFAPWVNHIFIVTDNQTPKWLDTKNSKITVIDLMEIMPKEALPCFNSTIIEFFIPNIPNLSEHFIYANDDMLFMAKTKQNYFFTKKGVPIIRARRSKIKNIFPVGQKFEEVTGNASIYDRNKLNSKKLVYDIVGDYNYCFEDSHNIDAYRKLDILNILNIPMVAEKFGKTIKNHFRDENDFHRILFHLFGVAKYDYKTVGRDFWTKLFQYLTFRFREQPIYTDDIKKYMSRSLFHKKLTCVQERSDARYTKSNHDYLMKIFPDKSEFEK